jgi:hypothetical protein
LFVVQCGRDAKRYLGGVSFWWLPCCAVNPAEDGVAADVANDDFQELSAKIARSGVVGDSCANAAVDGLEVGKRRD